MSIYSENDYTHVNGDVLRMHNLAFAISSSAKLPTLCDRFTYCCHFSYLELNVALFFSL